MSTLDLDRFPTTGRFLAGRVRRHLSYEARCTIEGMFGMPQRIGAGEVIVPAHQPVSTISILVEGFVIRTIASGNERSIVGIQLPGDLIDLPALGLGFLDHDAVALGRVVLARAPQPRMRDMALSNNELGRALWIASQLDATIQRQWAVKLGRLKASRRVARLLSELWCRLEMIGLADEQGYRVPMTQQDLADMCGTTAIHMNRALGELRRMGLAEFRRGEVTARDREALEDYGEFRHDYLTTRAVAHADVMAA